MKKLHVFVIILVVFLSGCTADESAETPTANYVGLVTSVYADSLPSTLYEGDQLFLQLQVENQGDYDVESGNYWMNIKGINPDAFKGLVEDDLTKTSGTKLFSLGDFGNDTIVRGQEVFTIGNTFMYCNDIDNDLSLNLHAKSCYDYGTTSEISACFIKSTATGGDEVCLVSEFKPVTNSIAPLAITEIAESVAGSSAVRFRVKVENLGKGTVFDKYAETDIPTTLSKCDTLRRDQENVVYIESITLDGNPMNLDYEGGVEQLDNGRDRFRLDSTGAGRFSFTTITTGLDFVGNVEIKLSYGYSETDIFRTTIQALSDFQPSCSSSGTSTNGGGSGNSGSSETI